MSLQDEINKTWDEIAARGNAERAAIQAKFDKEHAEIVERHRKIDRNMNLVIGISLLALGVMVVSSILDANSLSSKNDVCLEAGGVFVKTYDGYKCYSTDFRQVMKIGE